MSLIIKFCGKIATIVSVCTIYNIFDFFRITRTVRTVSQMITSPGGQNEADYRHSMQTVLDQFMSEERNPH